MPIPTITGIYQRRHAVCLQKWCDITFTPRVGQSSVICQLVMRVCITLMQPDDNISIFCFMLYFEFQLMSRACESKEW